MTRVCVRGADATEEERRWATCMLLSRACAAPTPEHRGEHPSVLMPFLDLLNHGESCRHETEGGSAVIVAAQDIRAGDELTWPYMSSPSKARLLTSFGFSDGPSASLAAAELPPRDRGWLAARGCQGTALERTDLELRRGPGEESELAPLTEDDLRTALRCVRLQVYEPRQAEHALVSGYFDRAWSDVAGRGSGKGDGRGKRGAAQRSLMAMDAMIARRTGQMCAQSLMSASPPEEMAVRLAEAEAGLAEALQEEVAALQGCATVLEEAADALEERLRWLEKDRGL